MVSRVGVTITGGGLAVLVAGTFLPWLRSGPDLRDSYESLGVLRGLVITVNAPMLTLLDCWLAIIPAITICIALYALRLRRTAVCAICLIAFGVGLAAGFLTLQGDAAGRLVDITQIGPAVTLIGALITLVGGLIVLYSLRESTELAGQ